MPASRGFQFHTPHAPDRVVVIRDLAAMKVFYDRQRFRILKALMSPMSARELAEHFETTPQRLNHHLKLLQEAGFLRVVEERRRGRHVERVFGLSARRFRLAHTLDPSPLPGPARAFMDDLDAAVELIRASSDTIGLHTKSRVRAQSWVVGRIDRREALAFDAELRTLVARYFKDGGEDDPRPLHGFLGVVAPIAETTGAAPGRRRSRPAPVRRPGGESRKRRR